MNLRISFQNISHSDAIEQNIKEKVQKLRSRFLALHSFSAVIGQETSHGAKSFFLNLDMKIPGREIAISGIRHADAHLALRDAFEAATRRLESEIGKSREGYRGQ